MDTKKTVIEYIDKIMEMYYGCIQTLAITIFAALFIVLWISSGFFEGWVSAGFMSVITTFFILAPFAALFSLYAFFRDLFL